MTPIVCSWYLVVLIISGSQQVSGIHGTLTAIANRSLLVPCISKTGGPVYPLEGTPKDAVQTNEGFVIKSATKSLERNYTRCGNQPTNNSDYFECWHPNVLDYVPLDTPRIIQGAVWQAVRGREMHLECEITLHEGEWFNLRWIVPNSVPDHRWSYNTDLIVGSDRKSLRKMKLTVKDVEHTDAGEYICAANDYVEKTQSSVRVEIRDPEPLKKPVITQGTVLQTFRGKDLKLDCQINVPIGDNITMYWNLPSSKEKTVNYTKETTLDADKEVQWRSHLAMNEVVKMDGGEYTCVAKGIIEETSSSIEVQIQESGHIIGNVVRVNLSQPATLSCDAEWYDLSEFTWRKNNASENGTHLGSEESQTFFNETSVRMHLNFTKVTRDDNGTYECRAIGGNENISSLASLTVTEKPEVMITYVKPLGDDSIYLEWEIYDGNEPVESYPVELQRNGTDRWEKIPDQFNKYTSNHRAKGLEKGTAYRFRIQVKNSLGFSQQAVSPFSKTFAKDPEFTPDVSVDRVNDTAIRVRWTFPSEAELRKYFNSYEVNATYQAKVERSVLVPATESPYILSNLISGREYVVTVRACDNVTKECSGSGSSEKGVNEAVAYLGFAIAFITFPIMGTVLYVWKRRDLASRKRFMEKNFVRFKTGALRSLDPKRNMADQAELLPYDEKWEFPKEQLKLGKVLGSGAFGIVKKGRAISILKKNLVTTVAVKMLRPTFNLDHMTALSRELKILAHLGKHLNVVNLLGACTARMSYGELLVIVEFCRFGNIRDYILSRRDDFLVQVDVPTGNCDAASTFDPDYIIANNSGIHTVSYYGDSTTSCSDDGTVSIVMSMNNDEVELPAVEPGQCAKYVGDFTDRDLKPINTRDLLSWGWQVSRGMKYLSSKRVVHGDLAARNILLADCNVVKICDFGLAKSLYESDTYEKKGRGPLPVKWMAIESIRDRLFSVKSDVWSFGVVLWEFFTLAQTPWPGVENENVYQKLINGFRMEQPKYVSEDMYEMMLSCWNAEPSKRPSFDELEESIEGLLDENVKSDYMKLDAPFAELNAKELAEGKTDYFTMDPSQSTPSLTESEKDQLDGQ